MLSKQSWNVAASGRTSATRAKVNELYAADKSTRITAQTDLILKTKHNAKAVGMLVEKALVHPENTSAVLHTLVILEGVDAEILKHHRRGIENLLAMAQEKIGEQAAVHIKKVERLLNQ